MRPREAPLGFVTHEADRWPPVCDDTYNLNETESKTFSIPNFYGTESNSFFDTESNTTQNMEKFSNGEISKPNFHTLVVCDDT